MRPSPSGDPCAGGELKGLGGDFECGQRRGRGAAPAEQRLRGSSRRQVAHHRRDHPVADQMQAGVGAGGQAIAVRQTHQPRRLARGEQSRAHLAAVGHQHELARRAAAGRAQAAGEAVEARLGALGAAAHAPEHGPHPPLARGQRRGQPLAVQLAHQADQRLGLRHRSARPPRRPARAWLRGRRCGAAAPAGASRSSAPAARRAAVRIGLAHRPAGAGSALSVARRVLQRRDDHAANPRLRDVGGRVDLQRAEAVASAGERRAHSLEVAPAVRVEEARAHFRSRWRAARGPAPASASISHQKPKKADDLPPERPARAPARLRSWQGLDAQARSARPGRSWTFRSHTSPWWKSSLAEVGAVGCGLEARRSRWRTGTASARPAPGAPCRRRQRTRSR